jgi:uncharacterized protein (TIGR02145 family)
VKYHYRLTAGNYEWVGYTSDRTFTFKNIIFNPDLEYNSLIDIEGTKCKSIDIGTQTWMAENLKTVTYIDGTKIYEYSPFGMPPNAGAYRFYGNEADFSGKYGNTYNWYAVNSGKLCPAGWHVASDSEWIQLIDYVGGTTVAGGKLKETGTLHWDSPIAGAENSSGFSATGSGDFVDLAADGTHNTFPWDFKRIAYFWSIRNISEQGIVFKLFLDTSAIEISNYWMGRYYPVRCLKN